MRGLLILGFGGHARSVADVALSVGVSTLLFVEPTAGSGETWLGFPVVREYRGALPSDWRCMPAAGDNFRRERQVQEARSAAWPLAVLVAHSATLGPGATLAEACFIGHHAHLGPMARLGSGCIVNTAAVIDHESVIGDFVHVSVNATVAGRSRVGDFVFLGAGSTVIDGIEVAARITLGAGGVVVRSLTEPGTYVGAPARLLHDP